MTPAFVTVLTNIGYQMGLQSAHFARLELLKAQATWNLRAGEYIVIDDAGTVWDYALEPRN